MPGDGLSAAASPPALDAAEVAEAWEMALAHWDVRVMLSPPRPLDEGEADHWGGAEPLAYIDLATRQVVVNLPLLASMGAGHALPAVLAHELGHHVQFPHTLAKVAELEVMQRELLPTYRGSLLNLFFDLQVNEVVGRDGALRRQLVDVYAASVRAREGPLGALFAYYLMIYEALFGLAPGALVPEDQAAALEAAHGGIRADATVFASTFWSLDDEALAFTYAVSRFARYLDDDPAGAAPLPMSADVAEAGADAIADALRSRARARRTYDEARARGWIDGREVRGDAGDPFRTLDAIAGAAGGDRGAAFREEVVERLYRGFVERHLVELPKVSDRVPDPYLPTTTEAWEPGDGVSRIDWTASVLAQGALAPVMALRRELLPDGDPTERGQRVAVEIYLDTSGSMPNPRMGLNGMTLAALIVATSAARAMGRVRGVVYSGGHEVSTWMYGEETARRFLMRYAGGGTRFPFERMRALSEEEPGVLRLVISDADFLHNVKQAGAMEALLAATDRSHLVSLLLHLHPTRARPPELAPFLAHPRARLVPVLDRADLPAAAAALARALFG